MKGTEIMKRSTELEEGGVPTQTAEADAPLLHLSRPSKGR